MKKREKRKEVCFKGGKVGLEIKRKELLDLGQMPRRALGY